MTKARQLTIIPFRCAESEGHIGDVMASCPRDLSHGHGEQSSGRDREPGVQGDEREARKVPETGVDTPRGFTAESPVSHCIGFVWLSVRSFVTQLSTHQWLHNRCAVLKMS